MENTNSSSVDRYLCADLLDDLWLQKRGPPSHKDLVVWKTETEAVRSMSQGNRVEVLRRIGINMAADLQGPIGWQGFCCLLCLK